MSRKVVCLSSPACLVAVVVAVAGSKKEILSRAEV